MSKDIWYKEFGFSSNPFSIKPAVFDNEMFGNDSVTTKIVKKINDGEMVFISGEFGMGKTMILKKIVGEFRGRGLGEKRVIYYNCDSSERAIDYDSLLINAGGFLRRLFGIRKKGMILLLDEMQGMNKKDMERVKEYYDDGFFKSVVFVGKEDEAEFSDELVEAIGGNRFVLGKMSGKEAVKMVRKRIGGLKFLGDDMILKIFKKDGNSRNFLKNCEDVCRVAFEDGAKAVSAWHVDRVFG